MCTHTLPKSLVFYFCFVSFCWRGEGLQREAVIMRDALRRNLKASNFLYFLCTQNSVHVKAPASAEWPGKEQEPESRDGMEGKNLTLIFLHYILTLWALGEPFYFFLGMGVLVTSVLSTSLPTTSMSYNLNWEWRGLKNYTWSIFCVDYKSHAISDISMWSWARWIHSIIVRASCSNDPPSSENLCQWQEL